MKKTRRPRSFPISLSTLFRSPTLRQLVFILLSISLIPALVIFFSMYSISSQLIQQEVQTHTRNTLVDARDNVNEVLRQTEDVAFGLAIDSNVNSLLTEDDLAIGSNRRASLRTLLESTLKTNRSILNMLFLETPENTVYTFTLAPKLSLHDICIIDSGYGQQVLQKGGAVYWFDLSNGVTGSPLAEDGYIRCACAIYDASGRECLGILSLFVKTSALSGCLEGLNNPDQRQTILLLDQHNRIIASNQSVSEELAREIEAAQLSGGEDITLCGTSYLFSSLDSENTGWKLVSLVSKSAAVEELHSTWRLTIPLLFLPFVCVILAYFFAGRLTRKLSPIVETMGEIKQGNLSVRTPPVNDNIFDLFGQTLNETLDQYHNLVVFSGHQEALLTITRLKLLRGQLSPHFLYNILDSINWMLLENGQYEISRIITDLGQILRYSINESSDTVPLREEIGIIERYLSVSQHRFESRLSYSIYVAPSLMDYQIPRFLLQPIVENAVIHGVEKTPAKSTLSIRCYASAEAVTIDISNDGPSIPPETKARILESFSQADGTSTHIGLKNVYQRIQLFYGTDYGLSLLDMEPQGSTIRLCLPPLPQSKEGDAL